MTEVAKVNSSPTNRVKILERRIQLLPKPRSRLTTVSTLPNDKLCVFRIAAYFSLSMFKSTFWTYKQ